MKCTTHLLITVQFVTVVFFFSISRKEFHISLHKFISHDVWLMLIAAAAVTKRTGYIEIWKERSDEKKRQDEKEHVMTKHEKGFGESSSSSKKKKCFTYCRAWRRISVPFIGPLLASIQFFFFSFSDFGFLFIFPQWCKYLFMCCWLCSLFTRRPSGERIDGIVCTAKCKSHAVDGSEKLCFRPFSYFNRIARIYHGRFSIHICFCCFFVPSLAASCSLEFFLVVCALHNGEEHETIHKRLLILKNWTTDLKSDEVV